MLTNLIHSFMTLLFDGEDGAGSGAGGASGGGGSGAGGESGGSGGGEGGQGGTGNGGGQGGQQGSEGGEGGTTWTPPSQAEWDNLQRQRREQSTRLQTLEGAEAERLKEAGKFEELHKTEKERADALEAKITTLEREGKATALASRFKFRRPDTAIKLIPESAYESDAKLEKAFKDLAEDQPELIANGTARQQGSGTGDQGGSGGDDMNSMLRRATGRSG